MSEPDLDVNVATRMGLPSAVLAASIPDREDQIELAVLPPNTDLLTSRWSVVTHYLCDPDRPETGTSEVEECDDKDEAIRHYAEKLTAFREEIEVRSSGMSSPTPR